MPRDMPTKLFLLKILLLLVFFMKHFLCSAYDSLSLQQIMSFQMSSTKYIYVHYRIMKSLTISMLFFLYNLIKSMIRSIVDLVDAKTFDISSAETLFNKHENIFHCVYCITSNTLVNDL